jgi:hypothetical protein
MHRPNPVQTITQQRQAFSPKGATQDEGEDIQSELAMEIYARSAVSYMSQLVGLPSKQHLRDLAANARDAADAFFEQPQQQGQTTNGQG